MPVNVGKLGNFEGAITSEFQFLVGFSLQIGIGIWLCTLPKYSQ
jgi:hypothetical protein